MKPGASELPAGWEWKALGDIATTQLGKMLSAKARGGVNPLPYLRNVNVQWGRIDLDDLREMDFSEAEIAKFSVQRGDLVMCEGGEPGRCAIWDSDDTILFQKALHRIRPGESVIAEWLFYYFRLLAWSGGFASFTSGIGIEHLPQEDLRLIPVPVPPLEEQETILGEIRSAELELAAANADVQEGAHLLDVLRATVIDASIRGEFAVSKGDAVSDLSAILDRRRAAWETGQLAALAAKGKQPKGDAWHAKYREPLQPQPGANGFDLPAGWTTATVDQVSTRVQYGTSAKTGESTEGVPVLRMGNLDRGRLVRLDDLKFLPADHSEFPELLLASGDLLFNRTNSPELVGKAAVYREELQPCSFASYLIRVRLDEGVVPEYLALFLTSSYGRAWVRTVVTQQVGQANVNGSKLKALTFPLPPLAAQIETVERVSALLAGVDGLSKELDAVQGRSAELQRSVIELALAGRLAARNGENRDAETEGVYV